MMPAPAAGCDGCDLCCRLLEVQEIDKPFLKLCQHAQRGAGCTIYEARPESCRAFVCTWLASQQAPDGAGWDRMPPEMRPDRRHVVFAPVDRDDPDHRLHVHVDPQRAMAWTRRDVKRWIERIVGRGITVVLSVGHKHTVLRADLPNMRRKRQGGL